MQEEIANPSPQAAHDFAGLLAALAAAKPTELPAWNDEELPQDVATLSYERALRKHARYTAKDADGISTSQPHEVQSGRLIAAAQNETRARSRKRGPLRHATAVVPMSERDRKCASVTIRMSRAECEQLRERANEAGLTISAYLRSCTFEADALRAQVKQALAELRSAHVPETKPAPEAGIQRAKVTGDESGQTSASQGSGLGQGSRLGWLRRILPELHPTRNLVRA